MTFNRIPVSGIQNVFFDSENLDDTDLTLEQNYNGQIQSGIINNHFGTGILPDALGQSIIFDSSASSGLLDGKAIDPQAQPTDTNSGNQLEIELTGSAASGKRTVKISIIGLDFQNNLQYDRFTFHTNEKQISSKHFKIVLKILFNDFLGSSTQSFNLGGRIVIRETKPFSLSRDCIMVAQDVEPNIFFRDFFVSTGGTLGNLLTAALPSFNIDNLNITTGYKQLRSLVENDVASQIGQKFLATTNNIEKITLLMAVTNPSTPSNLVWTGDLIISIYQLQSTLDCPTDIAPALAIDFHPSNIPLAQLSVSYSSLLSSGTQLGSVPQPVDFIFSNTPVGAGSLIVPGNYYAITVKRAGSANTCQIQLAVGNDQTPNSRVTLFNGNIWVDVSEEDLWFQVWTDAAKVSDGQAYDEGRGILIPRTNVDPDTGLNVDYVLDQVQFVRNDLYFAKVAANTAESVPVQDERTGNPILSRQQFVPAVSLINSADLINSENVSSPLIIGTITDDNLKTFSEGSSLPGSFHEFGIIGNQVVIKVIDDPADGYRYDLNILNLVSELINGSLLNSKFIPNTANTSLFYRISNSELITMIYGDVNGDGVVDELDLLAAQNLIGDDLNFLPTYAQYVTLTTLFKNESSLAWQIVNSVPAVIASGSDGILTVNPIDGTLANFNSASANFSSIANIGTLKLVISGAIVSTGNNGTFTISGLVDNNDIAIRKTYYTSDVIMQVMRADITGDMVVDTTDTTLISNYINAVPPFPAPASPGNRVGTPFKAIRLTLEEFIDRPDDSPMSISNRATTLHPVPDIFKDGYGTFGTLPLNLKTHVIPSDGYGMPFSIVKQLGWQDYAVVSNSNPKLVPASFNYQSGYNINKCNLDGILSEAFPQSPSFDPGRNDFFIPNNLIMNFGGEIIRPDGYNYKVDMEVGTITFEIPDISFDTEKTVNVLADFVANYTGGGITRLGYQAMKFADCSYVGMNAMIKNQLRFSVAVQSFSPQLDGYDPACISGIIVDGKIGVSMDYSTGLLTLNFTNLYQDPVKQTLNTKIQIIVYIKKAGWNNTPIFVSSTKAENILGIVPPILPPGPCV